MWRFRGVCVPYVGLVLVWLVGNLLAMSVSSFRNMVLNQQFLPDLSLRLNEWMGLLVRVCGLFFGFLNTCDLGLG
jgi:hypothetical protein